MKKIIFSICAVLSFLVFDVQAQEITKNIVVEHYTNTRCGICANRNPGFFTNLADHPDVFHIAIYPSSPYSSCVLHQHNAEESDARTQAYGIYGGTPRLVIQGGPISAGENYSNASIFDAHEEQTTPISINVIQTKDDTELTIRLVIKAEADNSIGDANLFVAAVEQLINYDAPNGETEHPNVFRQTLNGEANGETVTVPAIAGDSIVLSYSITDHADWDFDQIYAMAILQDANDNSVIQVDASDPMDNVVVGTQEINTIAASVYPNPVENRMHIQLPQLEAATLSLYNTQGAMVKQVNFDGETTLELKGLSSGVYWLQIETAKGMAVRKIVKK